MVNSIRVGAWSRCATTVSNTGKISWAVNARRGRGREGGSIAQSLTFSCNSRRCCFNTDIFASCDRHVFQQLG